MYQAEKHENKKGSHAGGYVKVVKFRYSKVFKIGSRRVNHHERIFERTRAFMALFFVGFCGFKAVDACHTLNEPR